MKMRITFNLKNFEPVDEGERVLKITEAKCVPSGKPTKANLTFTELSTKKTIRNRYDFNNQYGLMAFGFLCRIALNIPNMGEFETNDIGKLVGKTLLCEVEHTEGSTPREDGTYPVYANIKKVIKLVEENKTSNITTNTNTVSARASIPTATDDLD